MGGPVGEDRERECGWGKDLATASLKRKAKRGEAGITNPGKGGIGGYGGYSYETYVLHFNDAFQEEHFGRFHV